MKRGETRRGLALILVVGILGILAVLAAAFVTMAQLERRASLQRLHATKALLLARSGIEDALARVSTGQEATYGGEDWDANGVLTPGPEEQGSEVYGPGKLDTDACPAQHAARPSFFRSVGGNPRTVLVDGRHRGYSGRLRGEQASEGNLFALKLRRGGIHVNGGDPAAAPADGYNAVLKRILGTLAEAVNREDGSPVAQADGENLIDRRPTTGWKDWNQVRDIALDGSQAKLDALRPYLALDAWTDKRVIAPNAPATLANASVSSWGQIMLAHDTYPDAAPGTRRAPDFERIPVAPTGRIVGRAPVDLAWARRHRPVLVALLAGLRGLVLDESTMTRWAGANLMGTLRPVEISNLWIPTDDTHLTADRILAWTSDLSTWQQWSAFCDTLPLSGTSDIRQAKRDILKANFNPNSDLNKFSPNPSLWKEVDKSDLLVYSTEFSLVPVQAWEAECVGRILDASGRVLGTRTARARISGPGVVRFSTQADFVCGDLGDLDLPGDEGPPRLPGDPGFLSQSRGIEPTWGHKQPGLGDKGSGLQSYPEPCVKVSAVAPLSLNPAFYDGNLQLATLEVSDHYTYLVSGGPPGSSGDMRLLLRFDDGFDPDLWTSTLAGGDKCQVGGALLSQAELGLSLLDPAKPNTLHPDGAYSEGGRAPAYQDRDNAHPYHGVISYWVKHNYSQAKNGITMFRYRVEVSRANVSDVTQANAQLPTSACEFYIANVQKDPPFKGIFPHLMYETQRLDVNFSDEFERDLSAPNSSPMAVPPHSWVLITAFWDFRSASPVDNSLRDSGRLVGNDILLAPYAMYSYAVLDGMNQPLLAEDITRDDVSGAGNGLVPHLMVLGPHPRRDKYRLWTDTGDGADATFDEFAIYDFGGAEPTATTGVFLPASQNTLESALNLGNARYKVGRYYKGDVYSAPGPSTVNDEAGSWISAPIRLQAGSLLHGIHWTFLRPAALPDDYAEVEVLDLAGADYLWDGGPGGDGKRSRSTLGPNASEGRDAWAVGRSPFSPFRIRVVFRRKEGSVTVTDNIPILDSPVLDDLTLLYTPPQGPRVLAWEEGA